MIYTKRPWFKNLLLVTLLSFASIGGLYYSHKSKAQIYDFVETRDMQKILDLFDQNWYWLTPQSREEYDPTYNFKYHASTRSPQHIGNLIIKVFYEGDAFVGFIAYHKEQFYSGRILFVSVNPEFRSKGYGAKLLEYAINDLKGRGVTVLRILTRTENFPGQALYKKSGFKEDWRDDKYVEFIRYL